MQVHCGAPFLADGGLSDSVPYELMHHHLYRERREDGYFWLSIYDLCMFFEIVHECRLVNSGDKGAIPNMPAPRLDFAITPCHVNENKAVRACLVR